MTKLNVLITGATGMIGEALLYECLHNENIESITVFTRRPTGYFNPRLTEIIKNDFSDLSANETLLCKINACFYCIGTSAVGKTEAQYTAENYTLPVQFATALSAINPSMVFCYISGVGTDSTEKGRVMWARVKGKTENDLMKLPFDKVYNLRPAGLLPFLPLKPTQTYYRFYRYSNWLMKLLKPFLPMYLMDLRIFTSALINVALMGYPKNIIDIKDIKILASLNT